MPKLIRTLAVLALAAPALAAAQVQVEIRMDLPAALPPLVVVEPGVQVVQDYDEEIFFVNGYYWVRRDDYWYRTRDYRGAWVYVEPRRVPPGLVRIPPGRYKHWRKEERKAEKRAWKEQEKAEKREWKEERKRHKGHGRED